MDWEEVWEAAVGPGQVALLLRLALDDSHLQVVAAAAKALVALLGPSPPEESLLSLSDLCPLPGGPSDAASLPSHPFQDCCLRREAGFSGLCFPARVMPLRPCLLPFTLCMCLFDRGRALGSDLSLSFCTFYLFSELPLAEC